MELTDKWLMETGGWQAMKTARGLWQAGAVKSVEFDGTVLQGSVRGSGKDISAGLTIKGRSDVENRCTCYMARRDGRICEHSLALGVAWVHRHEKAPAAASAPSSQPAAMGSVRAAIAPATAKGALSFGFAGNFMEGLRRDRLTVVVETGTSDAAAQAADASVLAWLGMLQQKTVPPHLMLSGKRQVSDFLSALAGHPRLFIKSGERKTPLRIPDDAARLLLTVKAGTGDTVKLSLQFPSDKQEAAIPASADESGWLWQPAAAQLQPLRIPPSLHELLSSLPPGRPLEKPRRWLAQMLAELQEAFTIDAESTDPALLRLHMVPAVPQFELALEGTLERLSAKLRCVYENGPPPFPPGVENVSGFPLVSPSAPDVFLTRNIPAEAAAFRRLERCGFELSDGELVLKKENAILQFFAGELERLQRDWKVTLGTRFTAATAKVERLTPQWTPVGSGQDWLAFDMRFASAGGTTVDRMEIARMLATGAGHKKLPNGKTAVLSLGDAADLNEVLRDVRPDQASGNFRVKRAQLAYLEQSFGTSLEKAPPAWPLEKSVPSGLQKVLRDYQKTGVQWLLDHAARRFGGILADEMGLGKTLQSLALITALREKWPDRPALIVCPKSLLGNWQAEARQFSPGLRVLCLHGSTRESRFSEIQGASIVLTSYQLLARDIAHHSSVEWGAVILDEAGFIRNPDTQAAKAARSLKAEVKIALTGTPIENGVRDLWSIMEFALPGYLGSRDDFRERYETPLASGGSPQVMGRLRRRMAPYILRRLKQDVAKDLPSKIEIIHSCELSPVQRDLYAGLLREGAAKVLDAENAKQKSQARLHMLTALLRLRQTCCDPRLLPAEQPRTGDAALSGKVEALAELLDEIKEGGHSVIIFSAFASMLRLIEKTVQDASLGYCYLDGQTQDRTAQVTAFQSDPDKRVFLISLKAGGYGLNLTKADTVIHFDPWWNPAVEAQATDRAHRIGQSRPVSVYKLITTGTVEEKILKLQQKKRGLMDSALDDAAPLMDGLTDDDLRSLVMEG
ncbi:MAG TPA: SNF2-related protein [Verrucomicrobiales bacterium]|nr:SNF2-related protein [Verrucomicrobiales bacterium]